MTSSEILALSYKKQAGSYEKFHGFRWDRSVSFLFPNPRNQKPVGILKGELGPVLC